MSGAEATGAAAASRRQARRVALVLLYQHDVTGHAFADLEERYAHSAGAPVPPYARQLVEAVTSDAPRLDALISEHAHGWDASRISPIERAALRIAVHELEGAEVPAAVAIDEAVRLAKRYASPEAGTFVNGVLGGIARALGVGR